ncbi:MAG: hypothetical protein HYY93_09515 [Planctomycetes bacterium]|nr:hypothetical protein [Planctomycetota bacterium]
MRTVRWIPLFVLMALPLAADETAQHPWAKFKVGSWVKTKTTTTLLVAGNTQESVTEMKQTLTELTDTEATIQTDTTVAGNTFTSTMKIPLKSEAKTAEVKDAPKPETGEEEITVAGKQMKTRWMKTATEANGMKTRCQMWTSDEVPGAAVKSVTHSEGAVTTDSVMEVVEFEAKK